MENSDLKYAQLSRFKTQAICYECSNLYQEKNNNNHYISLTIKVIKIPKINDSTFY